MKSFCSKCSINWAQLWSMTSDDECEQVEFCPLCRNDEHLQPGNELVPSFVRCAITGKITDVETGKELDLPLPFPPPPKHQRKPAMTITEAKYERKCDAALDAYLETGNAKDYFEQFKP